MNKKGLAPIIIFVLIALGIVLISGTIGGFAISYSLKNIPVGVWIIIAFFILFIIFGGKKRK